MDLHPDSVQTKLETKIIAILVANCEAAKSCSLNKQSDSQFTALFASSWHAAFATTQL